MRAALGAACRRPADPPKAEPPTLDVTTGRDKTELFMEYPPLVAGRDGALCGAPDAARAISARDAGRPRIEFTPEAGGAPIVAAGLGAVAARRVPRRGRAAGRRPLSLGAGRRRARTSRIGTTSARSRSSPTSRRPIADAETAAGGRSGGDRLSQGTAVDQRVRHGAGAGSGAATSHSRAGRDRAAHRRRSHRRGAGGGTVHGRHAARRSARRCARARRSAGWSRG